MKIEIISIARSGSRYLKELLIYHLSQQYLLYSEPFNEIWMTTYSKRHVGKVIKKCKGIENVLIKTHINDLHRIDNIDQKEYFFSDHWYKILLLRKDMFNSTLSHAIALEINNFNLDTYEFKEISISLDKFVSLLYHKIEQVERIAQMIHEGNYDQLVYFEDLTFNRYTDLKLFDFEFDVTRLNIPMPETKTPNMTVVLNRDELYNKFLTEIQEYTHPLVTKDNGFFEIKNK